jgi:uncharacterized membrane protein
MIRNRVIRSHTVGEAGFRWRGSEVTRLEGFTDAVFAFAVTLLVVSLEVPKTFPELMQALRGFGAFGLCFALLANVWYQHYRYFRRYGLENPWTVALNCALLFFVLFYVYPLKFMFIAALSRAQFSAQDARTLYSIFSLGFAAVSAVFLLLYQHAWQIRTELALSPVEQLRTRRGLIDHAAMVLIGASSLLAARVMPPAWLEAAGMIYLLIPVYYTLAGLVWGRREERLLASPEEEPAD